ncbi:MAG: phosphoketolase family protein [Patescibacteria group bacterium]|nr:phosphoketolase family protein [Patescibacteria group bacterium]
MKAARKRQLDQYLRAANYLAASQIYLRDNALLERPLTADDIKPRLLGHWGSSPGINFIYAHLNELIGREKAEVLFVMGPGHAYAALQANLYIEGTLGQFYKRATPDRRGASYVIEQFSWAYGFPSHANPGTPGAILEGGELGSALATAYGAALDNPELVVATVIGDGEAETGPTATAWHLNKLLSPRTDGAVLPIVHLNGYKISGPTIYGRMSDEELTSLFRGYGYKPIIVDESKPDARGHDAMEAALAGAYKTIRKVQAAARGGKTRGGQAGKDVVKPRWPVIILRTPKGWTGPKLVDGEKVEGTFRSHQVVAKDAKTDPNHLRAIERWLRSYRFDELFDPHRGFNKEIRALVPPARLRMGLNRHAFGTETKPLKLPEPSKLADPVKKPGQPGPGNLAQAGEYLKRAFRGSRNSRNLRLFSPDETYSNRLDGVFDETARAWQWPLTKDDRDMARDGRVMEMLSEHSLQGMLQGYLLTGRHGLFASYEAFIQIISSMADQYAKFLKVARTIPWRKPNPSLNYVLTSSAWRQEHNGFSHQNPGFLDDMLQRHGEFITAYFPFDGNSTLATLDRMLRSRDEINLLIAAKKNEISWLPYREGKRAMREGLHTFRFASDPQPDLVFAATGSHMTRESLAAMQIVREEVPGARLRFVAVAALTDLGFGSAGHRVDEASFQRHFTPDRPVIFDFHGYPETLKSILFDYERGTPRFSVHGYLETGSTTTPFDMLMRNEADRIHLAIAAFETLADWRLLDRRRADNLKAKYEKRLAEIRRYVIKHGDDPADITEWQWRN